MTTPATNDALEADYRTVLKALEGSYICGECFPALERMRIALTRPTDTERAEALKALDASLAARKPAKDRFAALSDYSEYIERTFDVVIKHMPTIRRCLMRGDAKLGKNYAPEPTGVTANDVENGSCGPITGETSDGYHTFNELYEHRHALFIALAKAHPDKAWKSWEHDDGSLYEGWFIAGIETPEGQVTYHLPARLWDAFKGEFKYRAPKWDGHTPADVINRLAALTSPPPAKDDGVDLDKIVETLQAEADFYTKDDSDYDRGVKQGLLSAIEAVKQARG